MLKRVYNVFVDRVLALPCLLCLEQAPLGLRFCARCFESLPWVRPGNSCPQCALPNTTGHLCGACQNSEHRFGKNISALNYEWPVDRLFWGFKNHYNKGILYGFVPILAKKIKSFYGDALPDFMVPVPLTGAKKRHRGYNQAAILACFLARHFPSVKYISPLTRLRSRSSIVGLKRKERLDDIRNSFQLNFCVPAQKHLVIIDDVVTTGATVNEISRVFIDAGVRRVDVWSLARTPDPSLPY